MNFVGMLRIKNEARWIVRVLNSLLPICGRIYVLDDHSDDGTPDLCAQIPEVILFHSPFSTLDESRDKSWLLDQIKCGGGADVVIVIDGDEVLEPRGPEKIKKAALQGNAWSMQVLYLWDSDDLVRTDGVYSRMRRPSMFRLNATRLGYLKTPFGNGANLHCSSVPRDLLPRVVQTDIRLLHLGYRDREDRLRKYDWYNRVDPNNKGEDCYRHIVQGDLPEIPASARLRHAGPLTLQPFHI